MEKHILLQIIASLAVAVLLQLFWRVYSVVVATPRRLRRVLKQQGVGGPPPAFMLGNIMEIKKSRISAAAATPGPPPSDNCGANCLVSVFDEWRRQYGDMYTFSLGITPVLVVNNYQVLKEMCKCISLDFGKPSYQTKDLESLLGTGILSSNGRLWAHQRKIIAPELFIHRVEGMTNLIQQSTMMLIDEWKGVIDGEGGKAADIKIDEYLRKFSGDVISRACFGSSYAEGELLFEKFAALQHVSAKKGLSLGIPGMRYIPTKNNRREWEVQRDVRELILKLVKQKSEANSEKNMLKMILQGAESSGLSPVALEKFAIDTCKNIYIAGNETTAITASWCLMLLASNPQWQHRVREEVLGLCKGQAPDFASIRQMKQLTMVINETLRLYPPAWVVSREALNELEFGKIRIPKGVCVWMMVISLHTDPEIWGPDSYQFKPERFANGTTGACKHPHLYMPFGVGPRTCLGMNLAMVELKILVALLLSNFSFSLSPKYVHAPALKVVVQPGNGVDLLIQNLNLPFAAASTDQYHNVIR